MSWMIAVSDLPVFFSQTVHSATGKPTYSVATSLTSSPEAASSQVRVCSRRWLSSGRAASVRFQSFSKASEDFPPRVKLNGSFALSPKTFA
jgi:hypothetical protein